MANASSSRLSDSPATSLLSGLQAFSPPSPGVAQLRAALAAHAADELRQLIDTANRAAAVCPQCAPLAEALGSVATRELAELRKEQASEESAGGLEQHAEELRAAAKQGFQVLQQALTSFAPSVQRASVDPKLRQAPSLHKTSSEPSLTSKPSEDEVSRAKLRQLFGSVATDLQEAVNRIRASKAADLLERRG